MQGFFNPNELIVKRRERVSSLPSCAACGLWKTCKSPKMEATGKGKKGILVIAEAPGRVEDDMNTQLVGETGKDTRNTFKKFGIDLDRDCRKINAINCRPPDNETPTDLQIQYCRALVWNEIKRMKPKLIILLGGSALKSVLGVRWKKEMGGITSWRGFLIHDNKVKSFIAPTFHPSYVKRTEGASRVIWERDLEQAFDQLKNSFPPMKTIKEEEKRITILKRRGQVEKYLENLINNPPKAISYDYETTGLKPHGLNHQIITCSISTAPDNGTAFPFYQKCRNQLRQILINPKIKKIAANMKFEHNWTRHFLKAEVKGWFWDTMLASKFMDNRNGMSSLKVNVYIEFGISEYNEHVDTFLDSNSKCANDHNRILEADRNELLLYNGFDSMFEYRLAAIQMAKMNEFDRLKKIMSKDFIKKYFTREFDTM